MQSLRFCGGFFMPDSLSGDSMTRHMSLTHAVWSSDAVFTFHTGTPPHTRNTMTNLNTQQLKDQDLEQATGGARPQGFLGITPEMLRNAMNRVGLPRPVRPGENDHEIDDRIPR